MHFSYLCLICPEGPKWGDTLSSLRDLSQVICPSSADKNEVNSLDYVWYERNITDTSRMQIRYDRAEIIHGWLPPGPSSLASISSSETRTQRLDGLTDCCPLQGQHRNVKKQQQPNLTFHSRDCIWSEEDKFLRYPICRAIQIQRNPMLSNKSLISYSFSLPLFVVHFSLFISFLSKSVPNSLEAEDILPRSQHHVDPRRGFVSLAFQASRNRV